MTTDRDTDRRQRLYVTTRRAMAALIEKPMTIKELAEHLTCDITTAENAVKFWREYRLLYVHSYRRGKTNRAKVYAAGEREDAVEPENITPAERAASWRERGGDSHRARRLAAQARKIEKATSWAGAFG